MSIENLLDWTARLSPLLIVALGGLFCLLLETLLPEQSPRPAFWVSLITLSAAGAALFSVGDGPAFAGSIDLDSSARGLSFLLIAVGLCVVLLCDPFTRKHSLRGCEWYSLVLFALNGMLLLVWSSDLLVTFLAIELLSIPLYVLAAWRRERIVCVEAGIKYFLFGAFASGFLVYGMALLFSATGSFHYAEIAATIGRGPAGALPRIGLALLSIGLAFKAAAAPFHSWAPDVYQGSPTPITALMATGVKVAAFAALLRLVVDLVYPSGPLFAGGFALLAILSMVAGSLGALLQNNLKRLLAYSSISHAGFLMMGIAAQVALPVGGGASAVRFYLVAYTLTSLGVFAILLHFLDADGDGEDIRVLQGLSRRHPWLAAVVALCFLSFAGIPFTAGFFGKLYLVTAALKAGFLSAAIVLVITSLISLYYYLRVIVLMYMKPEEEEPVKVGAPQALSVISLCCAAAVVVLGLYPPLLHW